MLNDKDQELNTAWKLSYLIGVIGGLTYLLVRYYVLCS